jgi:hypothetical protein
MIMTTRRQVLLPLGTAVVVAVVAGGAALLSDGGGTRSPRPLRLAAGVGATQDAALAPGTAKGGGGYRLTGSLPSGTPDDAPAWDLAAGPADAELVVRLARALHAGTPVRDGAGWRAGGLSVSGDAGQTWWYSPCGPDASVSSDGAVGCAVATPGGVATAPSAVAGSSGSGSASTGSTGSDTLPPVPPVAPATPAPEPSPVPAATVRAGTNPVLRAVGLDPAAATVDTSPYGGSATVDRTLSGLPVVGLSTRVDVSRTGEVLSANGALAAATKGDRYPLVSAQQAFDALPVQPRMMLACPVAPDGKGCAEPAVTEITGARLGLLASPLQGGGQVAVPAWLFDVAGSAQPLAQVAVQPAYLAPPPTASDQPAPEPGTAEPGTAEPAPPAGTEPVAPQTAVSIDAAHRAKTPNAVVVVYGDSSSCPYTHVTQQVKESADAVYVFLQADPMPTGIACTADYRPVPLTVLLQAPLGDRTVHDGASSREVPLS